MTLTAYPTPHHVQYPRGVMCLDCQEFIPAELERCIACGSSAVALIEEGHWDGGTPEAGHPHHVEIACDGSGMVGYTRLTTAEITEKAATDKQHHDERRAAEENQQRDLEILRARAQDDPAFAILLRRHGIAIER